MEIVVFVLIAMAGVGVESKSQCRPDEIKKCMEKYQSLFRIDFGTSGPCNRISISTPRCDQYSKIVSCANENHFDKDCVVNEFDDYMTLSCKIRDFEVACPSAPKLNSAEQLTGTWTLLLLMFCSLLVCKECRL